MISFEPYQIQEGKFKMIVTVHRLMHMSDARQHVMQYLESLKQKVEFLSPIQSYETARFSADRSFVITCKAKEKDPQEDDSKEPIESWIARQYD